MSATVSAVNALAAAMEKYPTHAVNGVTYVTKVDGGKEIEDPSYVVEIPKPKASLLRQQAQAPQLLAPPTPSQSSQGGAGGGRLKSLGDR